MRDLASKTWQTTRSWQRSRVPACACRQGSEAACRGKSHHDSGSVSKAEVGLLQGYPLKTLTPDRGKQLAGHAGLTDAL
jgi:IS30 family transposase